MTVLTIQEEAAYAAQQKEQERLAKLFANRHENTSVVQITDTDTNEVWYRLESDRPWWIESQPNCKTEVGMIYTDEERKDLHDHIQQS